jgi:spore coat protein CotF
VQTAYFPDLRNLLKNNFSQKTNSPEEINYLMISDGKRSDIKKEFFYEVLL